VNVQSIHITGNPNVEDRTLMLVFGFIPPRARVPDAHDENRTGCDNACRTCDQRDWRTKDIKAPNDAIRAFADL